MRNRLIGLSLALIATIGMATAASAAKLPYPYGDRGANLQAMQWYAQQQVSRGLPNPYPGLNLYGQPNYNYRPWHDPYQGYNYGYNYGNYANPWYGANPYRWW